MFKGDKRFFFILSVKYNINFFSPSRLPFICIRSERYLGLPIWMDIYWLLNCVLCATRIKLITFLFMTTTFIDVCTWFWRRVGKPWTQHPRFALTRPRFNKPCRQFILWRSLFLCVALSPSPFLSFFLSACLCCCVSLCLAGKLIYCCRAQKECQGFCSCIWRSSPSWACLALTFSCHRHATRVIQLPVA